VTQTRKHCEKYLVATALAAWWLVAPIAPAHAAPITEAEVLAKIERHATVTGNAGAEAKWRGVHSLLFGGSGTAMSAEDLKAQVARSQGMAWEATWNSVWEAYEAMLAAQQQEEPPQAQQDEQQDPPVAAQDDPGPLDFGTPPPEEDLPVALSSDSNTPVTIVGPSGLSFHIQFDQMESVVVGTDGVLTATAYYRDPADGQNETRAFTHCVNGSLCTLPSPIDDSTTRCRFYGHGGQCTSRSIPDTKDLHEREEQGTRRLGGFSGNDQWSVHRHGRNTLQEDGEHWFEWKQNAGWQTVTEQGQFNFPDSVPQQLRDACTSGQLRGCGFFTPNPSGPHTRTRRVWVTEPSHPEVKEDVSQHRWFIAARHDGNNNYRAFGYWASESMLTNDTGNKYRTVARPWYTSFKTFASGTDPAQAISGVTGTATYRGEAAGFVTFGDDLGNGTTATRMTTFDQSPVGLKANFDTMRMDGDIRLNYHDQDGYHPFYQGRRNNFDEILPAVLGIKADMNNNGSISGMLLDRRGARQAMAGVRPLNAKRSNVIAQFYQPADDSNIAPGTVLGTFRALSQQTGASLGDDIGEYWMYGAFGAEKQR